MLLQIYTYVHTFIVDYNCDRGQRGPELGKEVGKERARPRRRRLSEGSGEIGVVGVAVGEEPGPGNPRRSTTRREGREKE